MASGKDHANGYKFGLAALAGVGLYGVAQGIPVEYAGGLMLGGVLGALIDPDVRDMHNITTRGERRWNRVPIIGRLLAYFFEVYWYPPSRAIVHRSFLSHLPPVSTLFAIAWQFLPPLFALWAFSGLSTQMGFTAFLEALWRPWMAATFLGWVVQDTIHLAQDGFRIKWQIFGKDGRSARKAKA